MKVIAWEGNTSFEWTLVTWQVCELHRLISACPENVRSFPEGAYQEIYIEEGPVEIRISNGWILVDDRGHETMHYDENRDVIDYLKKTSGEVLSKW